MGKAIPLWMRQLKGQDEAFAAPLPSEQPVVSEPVGGKVRPLWMRQLAEQEPVVLPTPIRQQADEAREEAGYDRDSSVLGLSGQMLSTFETGEALTAPPVTRAIGTTLAESQGTAVGGMLELSPEQKQQIQGQLVAEQEREHPGWMWAAALSPAVAAGLGAKRLVEGMVSGSPAGAAGGVLDLAMAATPGASQIRELVSRAVEGDEQAINEMPVVRLGQMLSTLQRPMAAAIRAVAENSIVDEQGTVSGPNGERVWKDPQTGEEIRHHSAADIAREVVQSANPFPDGQNNVSYVDVFARIAQAAGGTGDEGWIWAPGIAGDIFLDPATYLSFGGTSAVKASRQIQRVLYQSLAKAGAEDPLGKAAKGAQFVRRYIGLKSRDEALGPIAGLVRTFVDNEAKKAGSKLTGLGDEAAAQIENFGKDWGAEGLKLTLPLGSKGRLLAADDGGKWLEAGASRGVGEIVPGEYFTSLRRAYVDESRTAAKQIAGAINEHAEKAAAKGADIEPGVGDRKLRGFNKLLTSIFDIATTPSTTIPGATGGAAEMAAAAMRNMDALNASQRHYERRIGLTAGASGRTSKEARLVGEVIDKPHELEYRRRQAGEMLQPDELEQALKEASFDMASAEVSKMPSTTPEQKRLGKTLVVQQNMVQKHLDSFQKKMDRHFGKIESKLLDAEDKLADRGPGIIGSAAREGSRVIKGNYRDAMRRWSELTDQERRQTQRFIASSVKGSDRLIEKLVRHVEKLPEGKRDRFYNALVKFDLDGVARKETFGDLIQNIKTDQARVLERLAKREDVTEGWLSDGAVAQADFALTAAQTRLEALRAAQADIFAGIVINNRNELSKTIDSGNKLMERLWKHGVKRLGETATASTKAVPMMKLDASSWKQVARSVSSAYSKAIFQAKTSQEAAVKFSENLAAAIAPAFTKEEMAFIKPKILNSPWAARMAQNAADDWHGYKATTDALDSGMKELVRWASGIFDELLAEERRAGVEVESLASYIYHVIRNKNPLSKEVGLKRGFMESNQAAAGKFTQERQVSSLAELRDLGMDPTYNIFETLAARAYASTQTVAHYKFMDEAIGKLVAHHGAVALPKGTTEDAARIAAQKMIGKFGGKQGDLAPVHVKWRDTYYVMHPDQAHVWSRIDAMMNPVEREGVVRKMIGAMNWWKSAATVARPGFHLRNMWSNAWNMYLGGWDGRHLADAAELANVGYRESTEATLKEAAKFAKPGTSPDAYDKLVERMRKQLFDRGAKAATKVLHQQGTGNRWTMAQLYDLAVQNGVVDKGWVSVDIERSMVETVMGKGKKSLIGAMLASGNPFGKNWLLMRAGNAAGRGIENHARLTLWLSKLLDDGMSPEDAAIHVKKFMFDYKDLSQADRWIKQTGLAPFWTWTRKNLPLQMEMMFKSPGKQSIPFKTKRWSDKRYERYQEDYRKVAYPMLQTYLRRAHGYNWVGDAPWPGKEDLGTPMVFSPDMPYRDLNTLAVDGDEGFFGFTAPVANYFKESLHPFLKMPLEFATGQKLQTQQRFTSQNVPGYRVPFTEVPLSVKGLIPTWDGRTKEERAAGAPERPMADERYIYVLSTLFPDITTWGRTFGQAGQFIERQVGYKGTETMTPEEAERQGLRFGSDWTGFGRFIPVNKEKAESGWATRRREAINRFTAGKAKK